MGINCGASFAKYFLFIFNIIFVLGGAAVLGVGIWVRVDSQSLLDMLNKVDPSQNAANVANNILTENIPTIHTVANILIGVGSFVFLVGFMGCCGAIKQWRPLLVGYAVCLIVIICLEIGVGIAVGVYEKEVTDLIEKELIDLAQNYTDVPNNFNSTTKKIVVKSWIVIPSNASVLATNTWNAIQSWVGCCGVNNYTDFLAPNTMPYASSRRGMEMKAPAFCCMMEDPTQLYLGEKYERCYPSPAAENSWQDIGCVQKVTDFISSYAPAIIGVSVGIGLVEIIGVFFAFCLCCAIGDKRSKYN